MRRIKSAAVIVNFPIFLFVSFCFMYFEALLLDLVQIIIIIIITSLWNMLVIIVIL